jgi:phytoene dehydrogenase-like protein
MSKRRGRDQKREPQEPQRLLQMHQSYAQLWSPPLPRVTELRSAGAATPPRIYVAARSTSMPAAHDRGCAFLTSWSPSLSHLRRFTPQRGWRQPTRRFQRTCSGAGRQYQTARQRPERHGAPQLSANVDDGAAAVATAAPEIRTAFDALVIGSGIGGLVTATQLAQRGAKVAVFERYLIPGGSAGFFRRGGYTFDVGASMIFGLGEQPGSTNLLTKALAAVGEHLETIPDPVQIHYHCPDPVLQHLLVYRDEKRWLQALTERFPAEKEGIHRFYGECWQVFRALNALELRSLEEPRYLLRVFRQNPGACFTLLRYLGVNVGTIARRHIRDETLLRFIDIDCYVWSVMPADRTPMINAGMVFCDRHYGGVNYPRGGVGQIAQRLAAGLERCFPGCKVFYGARVTEIEMMSDPSAPGGKRAVGVRLADGRRFRARAIISNATRWDTFGLEPETVQEVASATTAAHTSLPVAAAVVADTPIRGSVADNSRTVLETLLPQKSRSYEPAVSPEFSSPTTTVSLHDRKTGEHFRAAAAVSGAGAQEFRPGRRALVNAEHVPEIERLWSQLYVKAPSFLSVHIGVRRDALSNKDGNLEDCHHIILERWEDMETAHGALGTLFVSIPTVLDQSVAPEGRHIFHVFTPSWMEEWKHLSPTAYREQKERYAARLLERLEPHFPGLAAGIEEMHVGTPRTHRRFLGRQDGTYGPMTHRLLQGLFTMPFNCTAVRGLYCVGDSSFPGQGLNAVAFSGFAAAHRVAADLGLEPRLPKFIDDWLVDLIAIKRVNWFSRRMLRT